jgi:hypothetical protein
MLGLWVRRNPLCSCPIIRCIFCTPPALRENRGIVRDTGGYAVALKFSMKYIYNVKKMRLLGSIGYGLGSGSQLHSLRTIIKPKYNFFEGKPIKTPDASTFGE